jgi:hypothetical protein
MLDETMDYTSLEEAYGSPFGQRVPITQQRKDVKEQPIAKPEFGGLANRSQDSIRRNQGIVDSLANSLPLDTQPTTENFSIREEVPARVTLREKFQTSQPVNMVTEFDQSDKISRILRLIEQNKTGYERPAVQDMVLYIATGIFFLFTFDTFVILGRSMRGQ